MIKSNSIKDMNDVISHQIASVLLPVFDCRRKKKIFSSCENSFDFFVDGFQVLLNNPSYKLLEILSVPMTLENNKKFSTETWEGLEKRLFKMNISNSTGAHI